MIEPSIPFSQDQKSVFGYWFTVPIANAEAGYTLENREERDFIIRDGTPVSQAGLRAGEDSGWIMAASRSVVMRWWPYVFFLSTAVGSRSFRTARRTLQIHGSNRFGKLIVHTTREPFLLQE